MIESNAVSQQTETKENRHKSAWFKVLWMGFVLYFLSLLTMVLTNNPNLFPTVVMIGNFLVPVTYVTFFFERREVSRTTLASTGLVFLYGGILGVVASSLLEPIFVRQFNPVSVFVIGLIEEFAKILGVILIARHRKHNSEMNGLILGAAAGMGFAALESMGYAFTAFLTSGGSLSQTVGVTLLRAVLAPIGHGTWTAILVSVLFRESRGGKFVINLKVIGAYLTVALLHAAWDGVPVFISAFFSQGLDVLVGQLIVAGTGFLILWLRWREARRLERERLIPVEAEASS